MGVTYPLGRSPEDLARKISEMMKRTQDMTPAMKVGAESVQRLIQKTFDASTSPVGVGWEPLAEATIKRRRKKSNTPLVDNDKLRPSMATSYGARTITFGTNTKYAGFHQFGTRFIPARPFLPLTRSGDLTDDAGPAKRVFDRIAAQVGSFIVNGRLR